MGLRDLVKRSRPPDEKGPGDASRAAGVRGRGGIFYGWWIVAAGVAITVLAGGLHVYGFSAYVRPLVSEFGWSRAGLSFSLGLARLEAGLLAPVVGFVVDTFGPRRSMVFGVVLGSLGFVILGQLSVLLRLFPIDSLLMFSIIYIGVVTVGRDFFTGLPIQTAVINWFVRKRGLAMALIMSGFGLGGGLFLPFLGRLISNYGWRVAIVITGLLTLAIGVPLALFFRHRPEDYGYLPDGELPEGTGSEPNEGAREKRTSPLFRVALRTFLFLPTLLASLAQGLTRRQPWLKAGSQADVEVMPREALTSANFWLISLSFGLSALVSGMVTIHYIPYLVDDMGLSEEAAADVVAAHAFISVFGRLFFGWMGDIIDRKYMYFICLVGQIAGLALFATVRSLPLLMVVVAFFALAYGGPIAIRAALQGDYFGRRHFGTISGLLRVADIWGTVGGPVFAGWVFDATGSYRVAYLAIAVATVFAAVAILLVKKPAAKAAVVL